MSPASLHYDMLADDILAAFRERANQQGLEPEEAIRTLKLRVDVLASAVEDCAGLAERFRAILTDA